MRQRCARTETAAAGLLAPLATAAPAAAQQTQRLGPWNGENPFNWLALADPRALRSQRALKRAIREVAA